MASDAQQAALRTYAHSVREARRAHAGISEPALAPLFQRLVVDLLPTLLAAPKLTVVPEFQNPGVGRPDIAFKRPGQPARAFIELKSADKTTDGSRWTVPHDKRQFGRFCEFAHWAICNFHEFRLYDRDKAAGHAVLVPEATLDPDQSESAADRLVDEHDPEAFLKLLERLAQSDAPAAKDAEQLAELLAHSARLVRGIVRDRLAELTQEKATGTALQQVRQEFRDVLYSHPEAAGYSSGDFDELFSSAFAQTLAFGLLLVREATGHDVDRHAADHMPKEHPLMKTALAVLSMEAVAHEIGAGFEVMLDTVNGFHTGILAVGADGQDARVESVDGVQHHLEAGADLMGDRFHAEHRQRGLHQRMLLGHMVGGVAVDVMASGLADEQQAKGESLGEGAGEEFVEVAARIARRLGVGVEHVAEFLAHLLKRRTGGLLLGEFGQAIPDDAAHEARRMGQEFRQLFRVLRRRSVRLGEALQELQERLGIMLIHQAIGRGLALVGIEGGLGHEDGVARRLVAIVESEFVEIADSPVGELAKSTELALVVRHGPAAAVRRLVGRFQLDEGARGLAWPLERDVRASDPRVLELGDDGQLRRGQQGWKQVDDQTLKERSERGFRNPRVGAPRLPNAMRVGSQSCLLGVAGHRRSLVLPVHGAERTDEKRRRGNE